MAQQYLDDGSINDACPPLQALLNIMATGSYQGKDVHDAGIREMFTKESLLKSDWYLQRLKVKQTRDIALWRKHLDSLQRFLELENYADEVERLGLNQRLETARTELERVGSAAYLDEIVGTIGADSLGQLG